MALVVGIISIMDFIHFMVNIFSYYILNNQQMKKRKVMSFQLFCSRRLNEDNPESLRGYPLRAAVLKYNGYLRSQGIKNYATVTKGKPVGMRLKIAE